MNATDLLARLVAFPTVADESNEALLDFAAQRLEDAGAAVRVLPGPRPDGRSCTAGLEAEMREGRIEVTELARYPGLADADAGGAAAAEVAALAGCGRDGSVDFGTEAGLYQAALDVPVVVCGPGDMAQGHVADEYLEADQLAAAERFIRRIGESLARP